MGQEVSSTLHSSSIDAGPKDEYDSFSTMMEAMNQNGYSKAYIEINPTESHETRDIRKVLRQLKSKYGNYSVQIFVREKGDKIMIMVMARKKEHNIERNLKQNLDDFVYNNYMHQGTVQSVSDRPIEAREF